MWRDIRPISSAMLTEFENKFRFRLNKDLRGFILEHNGAFPSPGTFPTETRTRKLERFFDFADKHNPYEAWELNRRLRDRLGDSRIIIGKEASGGFVCLERSHHGQQIVVWSHITMEFESCLLDIPAFLRTVG